MRPPTHTKSGCTWASGALPQVSNPVARTPVSLLVGSTRNASNLLPDKLFIQHAPSTQLSAAPDWGYCPSFLGTLHPRPHLSPGPLSLPVG